MIFRDFFPPLGLTSHLCQDSWTSLYHPKVGPEAVALLANQQTAKFCRTKLHARAYALFVSPFLSSLTKTWWQSSKASKDPKDDVWNFNKNPQQKTGHMAFLILGHRYSPDGLKGRLHSKYTLGSEARACKEGLYFLLFFGGGGPSWNVCRKPVYIYWFL